MGTGQLHGSFEPSKRGNDMAGENADIGLLQWVLGGFITATVAAFVTVGKAISDLRGEGNKGRAELWKRIDTLGDGAADDRAHAAEKYATRDDVYRLQNHIDQRMDRHERRMEAMIANRPPVKDIP